jgi:hydroxymethylpyrimidine/phosphomethylpyrimidine kinase
MAGSSKLPAVLSIAGSDSGGGAGIQADLKAFARCGVHGMTAITAITAQNTLGVRAVQAIDPEIILAQVEAVVEDIGVDAVKIGMLGDEATIRAVAAALDMIAAANRVPVVVDPVMVAESGARLLASEAVELLRGEILPRATVATPNIPEARILTESDEDADQAELARAVRELGCEVAVVTGGHSEGLKDLFFDGERSVEIAGDVHPGGDAHGSGCTHSSVLAARLALGDEPLAAARAARQLAAEAVGNGLAEIGQGPGPVNVLGLGR